MSFEIAAGDACCQSEAHGIKCWVNADDRGGWYTNLTAPGGVRLSVRASDAEAAIALLNAEASPAEINQIETEAVASTSPETGPLKKLAWVQILVGIVAGIILCLLYQSASNFGAKTYYHYVHGKMNKKWIYRNGYEAEFSEDRNLDGVMDYWVHYDAYGRESSAEYDNNFDGNLHRTFQQRVEKGLAVLLHQNPVAAFRSTRDFQRLKLIYVEGCIYCLSN